MSLLKSKKMLILLVLLTLILLSSFKFIKDGEIIGFHHPESIYPYRNYIYVSNIGSSPTSPNKDGFITKLDKYGNILEFKFITGLEAPKGIYAYKNKLYIADLTRLCIADLNTANLKCLRVKKAEFLNDVVVVNSTVYITDTMKNCIFKVKKNNNISVFFKEKNFSPNGIAFSKRLQSFLVVSFNKPMISQINIRGKLVKRFYLKGLTGFDGITLDDGKIFISDYRTGKIIQTKFPFKKYKVLKDLKTPVSDIFASGDKIFLPLIEKNKLIIGNLQ